jgi:hypothetical protein
MAWAADVVQDGSSANAPRAVRPPEDAEQLGRRLSSVEKLIEVSSAAKQVEASANPEAQAMRVQAREMRLKALDAYKAGDLPNATRLLDQAAKQMFEGARLGAPAQLSGDKKKRDFDSKLESVKALVAAQKRISVEKKLGAKGTEATNRLDAQMAEAITLSNAGKVDQARALLDQVYYTTKVVIEGLREGDTLVRSLEFTTKEDEYLYEVDRNDTHKMLIEVLLKEKRASNTSLDDKVKESLEKAASLRNEADGAATKKEFEAAIKLLETSTKELVRAIRAAGIYIPT